ncbi:MAG: SH3 domain-containing protein, partial [Erythrobacter sp.]
WNAGANAAGYGASKDGKMLVEAFVLAFNDLVARKDTIASAPKAGGRDNDIDLVTVAATSAMLEAPADSAKVLRSLRVGTTLKPTGKREGLFIQARDNFGTVGWVSIENLN